MNKKRERSENILNIKSNSERDIIKSNSERTKFLVENQDKIIKKYVCPEIETVSDWDIEYLLPTLKQLYDSWGYNKSNSYETEAHERGYEMVRYTDVIMWPVNAFIHHKDAKDLVWNAMYEKISLAAKTDLSELKDYMYIKSTLTEWYNKNKDLIEAISNMDVNSWLQYGFKQISLAISLISRMGLSNAHKLMKHTLNVIDKCLNQEQQEGGKRMKIKRKSTIRKSTKRKKKTTKGKRKTTIKKSKRY